MRLLRLPNHRIKWPCDFWRYPEKIPALNLRLSPVVHLSHYLTASERTTLAQPALQELCKVQNNNRSQHSGSSRSHLRQLNEISSWSPQVSQTEDHASLKSDERSPFYPKQPSTTSEMIAGENRLARFLPLDGRLETLSAANRTLWALTKRG